MDRHVKRRPTTPRRLVQHSQGAGGHLGEVFLLQGRQLGEEVLEGSGLNGRRMCLGCGPGVGEPETEVVQNSPDDLGVLS